MGGTAGKIETGTGGWPNINRSAGAGRRGRRNKKRKEILARAKEKREKEEAEARKAKRGDKSVRTTIAEETLLDDVEKDKDHACRRR